LTYGSATHAASVARHLDVNAERMRDNICQAGNAVLAESLALALAETITLDEAQALVKRAAIEVRGSRDSLVVAVRRAAEEKGIKAVIDWDRLADPSAYLGATNALIDRILDEARRT
jgi:3-carboxy-cis,cis-muconate cycloisomerase